MEKNKVKNTNNIFYKNRFVLASFLMAGGLMLLIYILTSVYPFGKDTVLRMDLYHQYGPLFSELYDKMFAHESFTYSWKSGLGSCFLGNYFNYMSSPVGAIVVFFGHKHVPEAIAAMVLIKVALSAGTFSYYLKASQHSHSIITSAFGVMYAFCAYVLAYYWNIMWIDAVVLLPLILLGIERIIDNGKPWLYIGSLALSMFSNYYMSFMLCMFAVVYFIYYYIMSYPRKAVVSKAFAQENGKKHKLLNSRFFRSGVWFAVGSLIAAGIMAFALIPTYDVLQTCSATSNPFPDEVKHYFNFFDFFANHLSFLTTTIRSSGDDVIPNVYCGILTVILAPLFFFTKSISRKEKLTTLGLLGFFYLSFNINSFNFIWHGLHFPNDLPYRFSFMYSFILLIIAFKTFKRLNEFTSRQILGVGVGLVAFVFLIDKLGSKNFGEGAAYVTFLFVIVYVMMLAILKDKKYEVASVAVLMCVVVCSEVIISDARSFPNNVERETYEGDYDTFVTLKEKLDEKEENNFYRMELTDLRTRMDPCWFGYNGVSTFSSMAYKSVSQLQNKFGMMSNGINSYTYNPQTPVYNMFHGLKYIVNNATPSLLEKTYYKYVDKHDKYTAYENKYYLPISFCTDAALADWIFDDSAITDKTDPFEVQGTFFERATGLKTPFEELGISYVNYNNVKPFTENLEGSVFAYNKNTVDTAGSAVFYVKTQKPGHVYVYFHVTGASSENVTFNTNVGTISKSASQDMVLDLGNYDAGETISVRIPFEENSGTVRFYAYTLNHDIFKQGYSKLKQGEMKNIVVDGGNVSGKITAKTDCLLYTSIPYDKGWSVYIDGKQVKNDDIVSIGNAYLGVKVSKGSHEVEMKYRASGLKKGAMISAICTLILLVLILVAISKSKRKKPSKLPCFQRVDRSYTEVIYTYPVDPKPTVKALPTKKTEYTGVRKEIIYPPGYQGKVIKNVIKPPVTSEQKEEQITDER